MAIVTSESEDHGPLEGIAARVPLITIVKAGRLRPLLEAQARKDGASVPYWEERRRELVSDGVGPEPIDDEHDDEPSALRHGAMLARRGEDWYHPESP